MTACGAPVVTLRRGPFSRLLPADAADRTWLRRFVIRVLIATNMVLGLYYFAWRFSSSINWSAWPIALALLSAEVYSFMGSVFFGVSMWKLRVRGAAPLAPPGKSVDVFITCYNEPVEIVRQTVRHALAIRYAHETYVLDDGNLPAIRAMAAAEGVGYIVRSANWSGKQRHAKAGNLNNALFQTTGEFLVVLDADQLAHPAFLDNTLAYFDDAKVAFVQTSQPFYKVPDGDPFGSHAPLFYGPIQQSKDGWNAAFFCGSNAVLRREALMQLGLMYYGRELVRRVRRALRAAEGVLHAAEGRLGSIVDRLERERVHGALHTLHGAVRHARKELRAGTPVQMVTWDFQRAAEAVARSLVQADLAQIGAELAELDGLPGIESGRTTTDMSELLGDDDALAALTRRDASPLVAIGTVHSLLLAVDMDRADEAQPLMPLATISVTEDMATAMRLHSLGWTSIYHYEELAQGLAPEDLGTALQQRLRWAQGTLQVLLRENPLTLAGLSLGQRMMYLSTMWSYLSGFFTVIYLIAPVLFLTLHVSPIRAFSGEFYWHLFPFLLTNQVLFLVIGWGLSTWRGQQYSLALFPIWIRSVTSAVGNVCFGRGLGFAVTAKTRQEGRYLRMIRPQLAAMALLCFAAIVGLGRLAFGFTTDGVPILVNVGWACYNLVTLGVVLTAATYTPDESEVAADEPETAHLAAFVAQRRGRGASAA